MRTVIMDARYGGYRPVSSFHFKIIVYDAIGNIYELQNKRQSGHTYELWITLCAFSVFEGHKNGMSPLRKSCPVLVVRNSNTINKRTTSMRFSRIVREKRLDLIARRLNCRASSTSLTRRLYGISIEPTRLQIHANNQKVTAHSPQSWSKECENCGPYHTFQAVRYACVRIQDLYIGVSTESDLCGVNDSPKHLKSGLNSKIVD